MPQTVMVIDDNPDERQRTIDTLASLKLLVVATSAHDLYAPRLAAERTPDVIFAAVEDPLVRSLQTIEMVRTQQPAVPVIGYSSAPGTGVFQQAVRAGASVLLDAPVLPEHAAKAIARAFGAHERVPKGFVGRVVAVVGQKGGIGKTTISTNLAASLAAEHHASVLIIDFDTSFGDVGLSLDVESRITAAEMAADLREFDREGFKATLIPHESGAFVLPAPAHVGEWLSVGPEKLSSLVDFAAHLFDYVVVDTPGAFNDAVAAAIEISDHTLIVTSLELTSVKNTAMLIEVLDRARYPKDRTLAVVNHTLPDPGVTVVEVAPTLNRASIWEVPYDPSVRRSMQAGRPIVMLQRSSPAGKSLRALAERIWSEPARIDRRAGVRAPRAAGDGTIARRLREAMKRLAS